eukprot:scaffold23888_cov21-Tisochrysis_lutea.AAC.4
MPVHTTSVRTLVLAHNVAWCVPVGLSTIAGGVMRELPHHSCLACPRVQAGVCEDCHILHARFKASVHALVLACWVAWCYPMARPRVQHGVFSTCTPALDVLLRMLVLACRVVWVLPTLKSVSWGSWDLPHHTCLL